LKLAGSTVDNCGSDKRITVNN